MLKKTSATLAVIAALAFGFISCGGSHEQNTNTDEAAMVAAVDSIHPYICQMHCEGSGSDQPGTCPVCGMDLIKNPDYKGAAMPAAPDSSAASGAAMDSSAATESH